MEKLKKPKHRSKVKQFYSEFNSSSSSPSSVSENDDPQFFTFGSQSFTSLMANLRQDINSVSSFSSCLNGTFP